MRQATTPEMRSRRSNADSLATGSAPRRAFVAPELERHNKLENVTGAECIEIIGGVPTVVPCS